MIVRTPEFGRLNRVGLNFVSPKKNKETPSYCQACDVYMHELCFVPYHAKFQSCPWSFTEVEDVDDC